MKIYSLFKKVIGIIIVLNLLFFLGCDNKKSKKKFFASNSVCYNLTREIYIVSAWGALSAETYSDYLTDSINFRVFVGTSDERSNFEYRCKNDSVYVIKLSIIGTEKAKAVDTFKIFSISELKRKKIFE